MRLGTESRPRDRRSALAVLALATVTLVVYAPVVGYEFVNVDDPQYVFDNPTVADGLTADGLRWAFTTRHASNWHPLTWLSLMLDAELFGVDPAGFHATNVMLHAVNVALLFLVLRSLTGATGRSVFAAGLFALHPLHVESVAWVAERKDVLSGLFWMLAVLAYARYARRGGARQFVVVVALMGIGLMAKPMLVTLPLVLLLLDYWPLGRWRGAPGPGGATAPRRPASAAVLVLEKLPLLLLALASGIVTLITQRGAMAEIESFGPAVRAATAVLAYVGYLRKLVLPTDLAVFYPIPEVLSLPRVLGSAALVACLSIAALLAASRRPYLAVGWFWYLITLTPVAGWIQVGSQAMADRYAYLPLIGIYLAVGWGLADLTLRVRRPAVRVAAAAAVLLACAAATSVQIGHWKNSRTLFERALRVTEGNATAHFGLGLDLAQRGELETAAHHYLEAIRLRPDHADAHQNLGVLRLRQRRWDEARRHLERAIELRPRFALAHTNLASLHQRRGRTERAIDHYRAAIRIDPQRVDAHFGLGVAFERQGRWSEAAVQFERVLALRPDHAGARRGLIRLGG